MNRNVVHFYKDPQFAAFVHDKQALDHVFFDTKQLASGGLGSSGSPQSKIFFDGNTASDFTLTNIFSKNQMEQNEVAAIIGVSLTPLGIHQVKEGANAAAINGANIAQDVDTIIKTCSVKVRIGANDYGPWPAQSCGGDGGLGGAVDGIASTVAASVELRSAPSNGVSLVQGFWKWDHPVLWYGNKALLVELIGATGALSAAMNVRIGIHCSPYWRNFRPETPIQGVR